MSTSDMMDWKLVIVQRLRQRQQRESGGFTELINSYGKLQEQVERFRRDINRLEYQNDQVSKELSELIKSGGGGGVAGGGGSSALLNKANKKNEELHSKVEELQNRVLLMSDDLRESQIKWVEATRELRESENKAKKKEDRIKDLLETNRKLEEKISDLTGQMTNSIAANKTLIDEHQALQTLYNSYERKLSESQIEKEQLRRELLSIKTREAERLNEETESYRRRRDEKLKDELRKASEEKEPLLRRGSNKDDKSPRSKRESSVSSDKVHVEEAMGPSIYPDTVFQTLDAHDNEVCSVAFSSDGHYLATGGGDKTIKVWSWRSSLGQMEAKCTLYGCTASVMSVQFDNHGKLVLAASNDYAARIWGVHDQKIRHTLTGHNNKVMAARYLDDNAKVVTGSHDRTLKIWDLHHRTCTKTLFAGSSCNDIVTGRGGMGNTIISGHFDKRIRFWDLRTSTPNDIALQGKVTSLDLFPERHLLLCCSRDDTLRLIDLRQYSITTTFSTSGFHVSVDWTRACFSPDGQYVAAGSSDGTVFVWETLTGKLKSKKEHVKEVVACAWHPSGQLFASADRNKKVLLWKR